MSLPKLNYIEFRCRHSRPKIFFYGGRNVMKSNRKDDDEIFIVRTPENQEGGLPPNNGKTGRGIPPNEYLEFIKNLDIIKLKPILTLVLNWSLVVIVVAMVFIGVMTYMIGQNKGLMWMVTVIMVFAIMKNLTPQKIKALNETLQNLAELIKGWFI